MGYHSNTAWYWTDWRLPTIVAQYNAYGVVNSGTCYAFQNLNNITHNTMNDWADIPSSGGVNNTHASPRVYCYGFGFDQVIPEGAEIRTIDVKRIVSDWTYGSGGIKDKLVTLRTSDDNTYEGWSSGFNTDSSVWVSRNSTEEKVTSKSAIGSNSGSTSWGATNVLASHVRRSNFGCVLQCIGTTSTWKTPRIYAVMMRVEYGVTLQYWVDPIYSLSTNLSTTTIKDDGSNNSTLTVTNKNTNNESGTLPELQVKINNSNICCFSDGSSTKIVAATSTIAGQSVTNSFTIIGKGEGSTTITITCGSNTKTVTINVEKSYVPPIYSATISLSSSSVTKGQSITATIKISNTNNVAGTVPQTTLSLNGNAKFKSGTALVNGLNINEFSLSANGSKSYTATIQGITVGSDTLTFTNSSCGTKTVKLSINSPPPSASITLNSLTLEENEVGTLQVTITNTGEVVYPASKVVLSSSDPIRFDNANSGIKTKELPFSNSIPVNGSIILTANIVGIADGTGTITATLGGTSISKSITIKDKAEYSLQCSLSTSEVTKGDIFQLSATFTNTNNIAGTNPSFKVQFPNGITTLDGKSEYTFYEESIQAGGKLTLNINLVATVVGEKVITINGTQLKIKVNEIVLPDPVLNSNWVYTTKTSLYPTETGQLIISYEVLNEVFPAIIPQTIITISGDAICFTDNSTSKTITQQTLLEGETFSNETDTPIFFKFKKEGTSVITISNSLLGQKSITIKTQYRGPNFITTATITPQVIEHKPEGGSIVTVELKTTNTGDTSGVFPGSTLTVTGGVLTFAENQSTFVLADVSIPVSESVTQTALIYTTGVGTGMVRILNNENNFNLSTNVIVEAPPEPEYSVSLSCANPSIPVWSNDEQISTSLKLSFINTNNIAGNTNPLIIYLEGSLVFTDNTSSINITSQSVPRGETVEYTIPKNVKSNTVGTFLIRVWDTILKADIATSTIDIRGATPVNKGWVNLENCTFIENKSSIGGALCNYGKYFDKNSTYKLNSASDKCSNIYDNGVCK